MRSHHEPPRHRHGTRATLPCSCCAQRSPVVAPIVAKDREAKGPVGAPADKYAQAAMPPTIMRKLRTRLCVSRMPAA